MADNFFNENDLRNLFPPEQLKQKDNFEIEFEPSKAPVVKPQNPSKVFPWKIVLKFTGLFAGIFLLTFIAINFNAISKNIGYFWQVQLQKKPYQQAVAAPTPMSTPDPTAPAQLVVPKIGVNAPILWNVNEDQVNDKLLEGVVHFKGTALPGQKGNIFITGHSSYYSWVVSPYKDVFSLLEKLSTGDKIYIQYQGNTFTYVVSNTKVVSPNELSVLDQTPDFNLTLMTCVPVGTNLNRLIVTSTQIQTN
ncbi:MAG: class D sortase [Patescibacteria group bacterium]|nr:class D sortase [Patescibacteria group bacterium]